MPARSSNSAGATYLDREGRLRDLREMARRAADKMPEIRRIILFGSMINGTPTPRSDADLLIEVESSAHDNPRDRTADVLRALSPLVCPLDAFVYTSQELRGLVDDRSPLVVTALRDGINLLA
jgi:predicted nucleotidyltransferase